MKKLIGIDIGGTKLGIGLGDETGKIYASSYRNNRNTDPEEVLPWIVSEARKLVGQSGFTMADIGCFGISAPFPADAKNGIMTCPTNNPQWRNVPVLGYLKEHLELPGCFENDANCGALAEWFFGAGRGCSDLIYLTMSTGIGGGIIANGRLMRGGDALSAGELGHICLELDGRACSCGMHGCYEAYCGGRALALRMQEEIGNHPDSLLNSLCGGDCEKLDMRLLEEAYRAGDAYAASLWREMTVRNAQAFGLIINVFNPQKLILGTLAWAIGDIFLDPILKELPRFCWEEPRRTCRIVPSELRREMSSYAGIAAALNWQKENGAVA